MKRLKRQPQGAAAACWGAVGVLVNFVNLAAAVRRRFVVCAVVFAVALCAMPAAIAQNARNTASVAVPSGVVDPFPGNDSAADEDPISTAQLSLTKTHAGNFSVGSNGAYTLTLSNISTTAATAGTITVADTLPVGLTFVSATGSGWTCGAVGQDVTCTTAATIAPSASAPPITLTVAVGVAAAPSVVNTARASGGGDASCPASGATQPRCNPSDTTTVTTLPAIDFCAANTIYNVTQSASGATMVGSFYRFGLSGPDTLVPQLNLPVSPAATNFNALMVDPAKKRLLVISYSGGVAQLWAYDVANGGWYQAAPPLTSPDFPRAGMDASGVGYLMAGNSVTPQVFRVTASGAFNYTIAPIGTLSFDIAPTATSSGDIAFDAGGNGWMSAGLDIYKIDFSTLDAVRQQRPLLGGSPSTIGWAGVAFGSDGRLYLSANNTLNTYYALDLSTGVLTLAGSNAVAQSRDLGSCAFPAEPQPAQLRVQKTLGLVNGAPYAAGSGVKAGDVLTYRIAISHVGGDLAATLFSGEVADTLPANTTPVAAGNDFTCAGSNCTNTNAVNVPAGSTQTLNFVVAVDNPLPGNVSSIVNAVTVQDVDCTAAGNDCGETTPVAPLVAVAKAASPVAGTTVNPGATINYTLTVTVANSPTTAPVTLTDTLSAGLTPGAMPAGCTVAGQVITCTLATGATPGTHTFVYPATVAANATGSVSNSVVPSGTDNPTCAAGACTTTHPVVAPTVTVSKSSNPASGATVNPGDAIQYTLSVNVADSATTAPVTLTDTLSAGQTLGAMPAGCSAAGQVVTCTLATGALPSGSPHTFVYGATVDANATGSVGNSVVPSGTDNPACAAGACATTHPIAASAVTVSKSSNPASGATVNPGSTIQYTLSVNVANSATTAPVTLTDTLSAGQTLGAMPVGCSVAGQVVTCTLAAGALPSGSPYTFVYSATVDANATGSIGNSVVPSGTDNPTCAAGGCTTTHPIVAPTVTVSKSSNPASGSTVSPGDTIQYTLSVNVANSATTAPITLTDTLSAGQTLGAMPAGCSAAGQVVTCTLAAGALPSGSPHTFVYSAIVDANATGSVGNSVVPSGTDNPTCAAGGCTTTHPIVAPTVTVSKSSNPASGSTVNPGDAIQYTLTVNVANSATTGAVTLTDTLSAGQTLGAMPAGCSAAGQVVTCTLAAGALPSGSPYTFVYSATVNANATGSIGNAVLPSGTDNPTCGSCTTTHPITATAVTVSKSSNPASGATVNPGDAIQYTLTVTVANSATTGAVTLTDTLSAGQTLGAMPAGCAVAGQVVTCTLAAGALPSGSPYTFVYSATVNANATGSIGNAVVPSGPDNPGCGAGGCTTTHPIVAPVVTVSKSSNPASGGTVNPGDAIQYTLTVNVANSATTGAVTLTDTLSAGQTLGAMPAGCIASGQVVTCTLAAGALPSGSPYTFVYSATVDANATGSIGNSVVPSGTDSPTCAAGGCTTTHPIVATAVTVSKTSNPASGSTVNPGDTIQYTLSVTVANSATTGAVTLTDTLSTGQTLGAMPAGCAAAGQVVTCTLAAGALPSGSPYTFLYSATVNANATGAIGNNVVPSGTDNPSCASCTTTHTIVPTAVTVSKSSNPASGATVNPGDTIQYTLTVNVANSATTAPVTLTDTLSAGQTLGAMPAGCSAAGQVVTCTLAAGALPSGSPYTFVYNATVDANATGSIGNSVVPSGTDNPTCAAGGCTTTHPIVATAVTVGKSSLPASGATVNPGDTIQYALTVNVANSATTAAVTLTDTLSAGQTLGALPAGCAVAGQVVTCTLAPGALPAGSPYNFVYSATVNANATGSIGNSVVPSGPDNPNCAPSGCATTHTIVPTAVTVSKTSNPASGSTINPGDTIQYTLTVNVANSATTAPVTLTDTLSAGQTLGALPAGCSAAGQVVSCVLGAGALPGTYNFAYPATVDASATGSIGNSVVPSGTDNPTCAAGGCSTTHTIVPTAITVSKSSNPASGSTVNPGDTLQYTLTVNVANSATTAPVTLTDTLSAGQTLGAMPAGCAASGQVVTCTLAAGALPSGSPYTFVYGATVVANATGSIGNNVVPSGTDNPSCAAGACTTTHPIVDPSVSVSKSSDPASGTAVNANATITYTLTVTVANSATTSQVTLADTLTGAQSLVGTPTVPAGGNCTVAGAGLQCTLAAGALPGSYAFVYQTAVAADASGSIGNNVAASGGGPGIPSCTNCATAHPIAQPVVQVSKSSAPGNGATINIGDTIQYTLTVSIANAAITQAVTLTDMPGTGLTVGALPSGCVANGAGLVCTLPAGTVPGTYTFAYPATVNADANGNVGNAVVAAGGSSAGGPPDCLACTTTHPVADAAQLRVVKQASPRDVKIGDLVRYTLTIENVGAANISDATLIDTPPAGFSYVADSLTVA
ncbi:MAG TPA: hypothetical protein VJ806_12880, partial [Luteimonas sp.]|nr:hypothetical protein [Luteimonas sp.]